MSEDTFSLLFGGVLLAGVALMLYRGARTLQREERKTHPFTEARRVRLKTE